MCMCTSVGVRREKAKKGDADAMRMLGLRVYRPGREQQYHLEEEKRRRGGGDGATLAFLTVLSSLLSRSFPFTIPCVAALLPSAPGPDRLGSLSFLFLSRSELFARPRVSLYAGWGPRLMVMRERKQEATDAHCRYLCLRDTDTGSINTSQGRSAPPPLESVPEHERLWWI